MESWLKDTYIIYSVTAEVIELNNRKNLKKKPRMFNQKSIMKHE